MVEPNNKSEWITLNNGHKMPQIGLGTFQLMDHSAITNAIMNLGYRHLDTAWLYQNEHLIGQSLKEIFEKSDIKREDLFITTKIWPSQFDNVEETCKDSLTKLGLDYIDLYLIHWPAGFFSTKTPLHVLWKNLEALVDSGLVRSLGLSNFGVQLTADLLTYAKHQPVCNQIELHPYCVQEELVRFLKDQKIVPVAYCPIGRPSGAESLGNQAADLKYTKLPDLRMDPKIQEIAKKYNKSEFQVVLRWGLERGHAIIPKSSDPKHQLENLQILDFQLQQDEVDYISSKNMNLRICNKFEFLKGYDIFA